MVLSAIVTSMLFFSFILREKKHNQACVIQYLLVHLSSPVSIFAAQLFLSQNHAQNHVQCVVVGLKKEEKNSTSLRVSSSSC